MDWKNVTVLAINGVITLAVVLMWGFGKITWDQALVALALLVTPSAGSALMKPKVDP